MRFLRLILGLALALAALGMLFWGCSESESKNPTDGGNGGGSVFDTSFVASHVSADAFDLIADSSLATATSSFEIYYGHTSHGSQIMSGLDLLENEGAISSQPTVHEVSDDLGHNGDTSWVPLTRSYLNTHPECNMAMWSWCGGCSDNTEQGINTYLSAMSALEAAYPNVIFVYMTGHLDGTGVNGNLYARNNQIRAYCEANDKVLFDFADIESYDPDGNYYPDESDGCSWCETWCQTNDCASCGCAHSHCFNCYRKGKAFMWLLCRLAAEG